MPRIRSIKPEFWEDEDIGSLPVQARLLYIATWSLADDEGLLRWSPVYLRSSVFMYDESVSEADVRAWMGVLEREGKVFPYKGGRSKLSLAFIVQFHRHQRINRPSPSKLPAPSLQNRLIREMYGRRDGMICHICNRGIPEDFHSPLGKELKTGRRAISEPWLSIDHVKARSKGGSDYPSNLRAAHLSCNISKKDNDLGYSPEDDVSDSMNTSVSDSVNGSMNDSVLRARAPEVEVEMEQGGGGGAGNRESKHAARARSEPLAQPRPDAAPSAGGRTEEPIGHQEADVRAYLGEDADEALAKIDQSTTPAQRREWVSTVQSYYLPGGQEREVYRTLAEHMRPRALAKGICEFADAHPPMHAERPNFNRRHFRGFVATAVGQFLKPINREGETVVDETRELQRKRRRAEEHKQLRPVQGRERDPTLGWTESELDSWWEAEATAEERKAIEVHHGNALKFFRQGNIRATDEMKRSSWLTCVAKHRGPKRTDGPQRVGEVIQDGAA